MPARNLALALSFAVALAVGGCSTSASGARQIAVTMTDDMRFSPATITVQQGETVAFVVHNEGAIIHEFFVGSAAAQDDHAAEMKMPMAVGHDHSTGVHVDNGSTKTLTMSFGTAGTFIIGCHEPGHWDAGMRGTITVQP